MDKGYHSYIIVYNNTYDLYFIYQGGAVLAGFVSKRKCEEYIFDLEDKE